MVECPSEIINELGGLSLKSVVQGYLLNNLFSKPRHLLKLGLGV